MEAKILVAETDSGEIVLVPVSSITQLFFDKGVNRLFTIGSGGYIQVDKICIHDKVSGAFNDYSSRSRSKQPKAEA